MNRIKTEVGVGIILATAILAGVFTVVGFEKTVKDLDSIEKAVQANQSALNEGVKNNLRMQ